MDNNINIILRDIITLSRNCPKNKSEEQEACDELMRIADLARGFVPDELDYDKKDDDKSWE